ncbi:MAG: ABC transporter ATP-binding protein [Xanthobacteraceae bacterium]|nr:ABC transporter ATP-binding protein [Xanthobacteraceae bacterium]
MSASVSAREEKSSAASAGGPLAAFRNVGKSFPNGVTALKNLDLAVREGEFLSLLGPSGCGKSTALRLLAGLAEPSEGDILRRDGSGPREIGFVFQEPTLMPWTTVAQNVRLPLRLKGVARHEAMPRVEEALALVGLGDFRDAYPRELSGGMRMRVSIARALVTRPRLLLMDEPFAALDEITRFKLNDELRTLWRTLGCTIVFVTHSVFESVYLSTRILMFTPRPGRIAAEFTIEASEPREAPFRTSAEYGAECRKVSAALARVMGEG